MSRGVRFDTDPDGELALGLEGGHSARRIVHAGGSETGRAITGRLAELVAAEPRIEVLEGASAVALWSDGERCAGVITDRGRDRRPRRPCSPPAAARRCGAGRPTRAGAIGAGSVLAHAAGAELADLELCQFHPTALALPGSRYDGSLITEAVRGEGATLLDAAGRRFTDELAPRDQVTAAILDRMDADGAGSRVARPARSSPPERFPNVFATCREAGLDPSREPVPGRARRPLPDRRDRDRPRRPHHARPACSRSASAPAPASTAPTGWPRTRSASASSSAAAPPGARSATQAAADRPPPVPAWRFEPPAPSDPRGGLAPRRAAARRRRARAAARRPLPARRA